MNRRDFLGMVAAGAIGAGRLSSAAMALGQRRRRRPNIILILADDLGYEELGCQGNADIPTPNIDSLARNGVRFTDGYVSAPVCCPSRAGLITGRYQTRFGHELNAIGLKNKDPNVGLPLSERTIADYLKSAGYATGMVGKWHIGGTAPYHPQQRGFDEFFGFLHEGHFFLPPPYSGSTLRLRAKEPLYDLENPILRGTEPVDEPEYLTEALTREALDYIDRHRDEPFFLYLPYNAVHSPLQATLEDVDHFKHLDSHRAIFAGMLTSLDDGVGEVLAKLRRHGLEEDTLIFFLSDNGGPTAELTSSNLPLRGGKGQLFEGGVRVPFIMQWKGTLPEGMVYDHSVSALDILPTAAGAAGARLGKDAGLDGVDLIPYLTGEKTSLPHEILFWRYGPQKAVRVGKWKLLHVPSRLGKPVQLYDLSKDIGEENDLSESRPEVVKELGAILEGMDREMVEPLWGPRKKPRP